jgi:hypothetical protein
MKMALKSSLLMIILLAATLGSNTAWAATCGSTFWGMMAEDCGYDRSGCYCESSGAIAGCTDGETTYIVDCQDGGECYCSVTYENISVPDAGSGESSEE